MPKASSPLDHFSRPTREYFTAALGTPTPAQAKGWPPIAKGESTLLCAPTGSGKTLAAFLSAVDRLAFGPKRAPHAGVRVLYVSPLKALAVDVERNLRAPLLGILARAAEDGLAAQPIDVAIRSGDTPPAERVRLRKKPPDILITTPESLYLMLTSGAAETLRTVETVIIDEIHQLVATKRGAHLFLSLERLEELRAPKTGPLQRIGLSATQKPLSAVARLLGGFVEGRPRPVTIVDAGKRKELVLEVSAPPLDMAGLGDKDVEPGAANEDGTERRSIWPHLHARIVDDIRKHRSTMVFVNSRRLAERLAAALNDVAGEELALAHHGSVAREKRALIEDRLKRGDLRAIVATSSLELGIDMGAVDLVIQVEAPPSIASGLQRIGRASHQVGGVPKGILLPKHRADLLACAAAAAGIREGDVEETHPLSNPLDVLAQQLVAICAARTEPLDEDDLYALVRRATSFVDLPRAAYEGVLDMLTGRYPADEFAELRPRLVWDRVNKTLRARPGARQLAIANGGTIPDRGLYGVFLAGGDEKRGGRRVGELDEEMVFELHEGEVFLLGASSWRADEITSDRVLVTPAAGTPGKMPFWHGDRAGRSRAFGARIGALARVLADAKPKEGLRLLHDEFRLDRSAADNLVRYVAAQKAEAGGAVPSDRTVVLERFLDDVGDLRVCLLSPLGSRVHAPWAMAILARLRAAHAGEPDVVWSDDGIVFRLTATTDPPPVELFFPSPDDVDGLVEGALSQSSLFAARFREAAARALLLPRRAPGRRTPLWAQRKRAQDLLSVASKYPSFPIVLETYRECLRDVFDLPGLRETLSKIRERKIAVAHVESTHPSPFATSLMFSFVANFIYDGDLPLAERRAHALGVDHAQLRELLGEAELRSLFDEDVLRAEEARLQRLERPAVHADALHELLLSLGDLSAAELEARCTDPGARAELVRERRVCAVRVAGEERFVAAEDAARYRDALGCALPRGLPPAFVESTSEPVLSLVARYARTHGPFTERDVELRFALPLDAVREALAVLERDGRVLRGAFRPTGTGVEHCGKDVLASLRRKALAALRKQVEPVDGPAYARFLASWQRVEAPSRHAPSRAAREARLLDAIAQLEGCPLPASALDEEILAARVPGYERGDLDALLSAGLVVWAGVESIGSSDGRIALYLAEHEAVLSPTPAEAPGELCARIRDLLARRGALFQSELARHLGGFGPELEDALWDMIWAGELTNDTLGPLRSLASHDKPAASRPRPRTLGLPARYTESPRGAGGRFALRRARWDRDPSPTERRTALAHALLLRYGVVVREAASAESLVGGFSSIYDVLKAMEESGRLHRGYFVEGRGATQFALPEAADRLRAQRSPPVDPDTRWLAATDPANPYGALVPWPEVQGGGPQRTPGAHVVLVDGALVGYLGRGHDALLTFLPEDEPQRSRFATGLAHALAARVVRGERRALLLERIDHQHAARSPLGPFLVEAGFSLGARGWMKRLERFLSRSGDDDG